MVNYLKKFDYFSTPFELKVYNQSRISSFLGVFFTIIIFGIVIATTITFGSELFYKNKPRASSNTIYQNIPKNLTLSENKVAFAFSYMNSDNYMTFYNNKSYFNIELKNYRRIVIKNETTGVEKATILRDPIEYELCVNNYEYQKALFNHHAKKNGYDFNKELDNSLFNQSICLKNYSLVIGGEYNSGYFSNIFIEINKCVNKTSKEIEQLKSSGKQYTVCVSDDEQNRLISGSNFQLLYTNYISNTENYTHPFYPVLSNYFLKLDGSIYQHSDFYFKIEEIISDNGFIFQSKVIKEVISNFYFREIISLTPPPGRVLRIYLNMGNNKIEIKRFYMKAQELAALVGGMIKICLIAADVICHFFNKYQFDLNLINHLFITSDSFDTDAVIKLKSTNNQNYLFDENGDESFDHSYEDKIKDVKCNSKKSTNKIFKIANSKNFEKDQISDKKENQSNNYIDEQSKSLHKINSINCLIEPNKLKKDVAKSKENDQILKSKQSLEKNRTKNFMKQTFEEAIVNKLSFKKTKTLDNKLVDNQKAVEIPDFILSYLDIVLIYICFFNSKFKRLKKKLEFYRLNLLKRTDYSEVLTAILSFKEIEKTIINNQANQVILNN